MEARPNTVIAKLDKKVKGKRKRFTVGNMGSPISGALYLKKGVSLPTDLTVIFQEERKGERDE